MIGYGKEDEHFVAELTYNYGVRTYKPGNVHIASLIKSSEVFSKVRIVTVPFKSSQRI